MPTADQAVDPVIVTVARTTPWHCKRAATKCSTHMLIVIWLGMLVVPS